MRDMLDNPAPELMNLGAIESAAERLHDAAQKPQA